MTDDQKITAVILVMLLELQEKTFVQEEMLRQLLTGLTDEEVAALKVSAQSEAHKAYAEQLRIRLKYFFPDEPPDYLRSFWGDRN